MDLSISKPSPVVILLVTICSMLYANAQPLSILPPTNPYGAGLPNEGIAQGSIFDIGIGGVSLPTGSQSIPLQTSFLGITIEVTVNGVTTDALPLFISSEHIRAVLPSATPLGYGSVTVFFSGQSDSVPIHVVQTAFGLMTHSDSIAAVAQSASQGGQLLS